MENKIWIARSPEEKSSGVKKLKKMKHKWIKHPDFKIDGIGWFSKWMCSICGCEKTLGKYKFAEPDFDRNGQLYSHYIECVDEKAEMLKTID